MENLLKACILEESPVGVEQMVCKILCVHEQGVL